jgi:hypothetical protein
MNKILILMVFSFVYSCNTAKYNLTKKNETDAYVLKINNNKTLEESYVEGVLTDESGNLDLGLFKCNTFFDNKTNVLYRIKNTEITNNTVTENFYFNNNKLVFITTKTENASPIEMYILNGKVVNNKTEHSQYEEVLLNKARLFQKEFIKTH